MALEKLSPIKKFLFNGVSKKSIFYFDIVILVALISLFLIYHFSKMPEIKEEISLPIKPISKEKETIKKQLEELEKLRTETPTLTEKEIQTQIKELGKLKGKQKSLSEEKIQKQLEELNKLKGE